MKIILKKAENVRTGKTNYYVSRNGWCEICTEDYEVANRVYERLLQDNNAFQPKIVKSSDTDKSTKENKKSFFKKIGLWF